MSIRPHPALTLRGDAYERGRLYGDRARALIRKGVEHYVRLWERNTGKTQRELFDLVRQFQPVIADYDGEILREIEGIAAGAKMPLEEILLINVRYELLVVAFFAYAGTGATSRAECTSLGAVGEVTTDGHTYVAQNWDLTVDAGERSLLLEVIQDDRPNIVTHVEAGLVAHKGLNSCGLGLCINTLGSQHDDFVPAVPVFVLARRFLNSRTLDEGRRALEGARRAASVNFTVGADGGDVCSLEITPVDVSRVEAIDGRVAHANVFCDLREGRGVRDELASRFPVLSERSGRAQKLVAEADAGLDGFRQIFTNREGKPEAICRHLDDQPPQAPEALRLETVVSMIMDLTDRTVYLSDGPPDRSEYQKHTFPSLS